MCDILYLDKETRSTVDLKRAGAYRYFEDRTTEIIVACYAINDGPVETWWPGQKCPDVIFDHVFSGGKISGWNVGGFEKIGWDLVLGPRHGWPVPLLEQYDDTAAAAAAMGLPRALGDAARALGSTEQKDVAGHRLMLQMCKPRRPRKGEDPTKLYWWEDAERLTRLAEYCAGDVRTERGVKQQLVPLAPDEMETWRFDWRLNSRGVLLDLDLVHALQRIAEEASADLDAELEEVSGVAKATQVGRLTTWLNDTGVECTSLAKAEIERMLALPDLPDSARAALEIRRDAAKTSTKKLKAMLACVSADGRARGQHLYHGAGTGRWSGRLIQVQNFPRGTGTVKDPEAAVPDFLLGDAEIVRTRYGKPMNAVSDMLRSCMMAAPGKRLLAADFASIEGRVTAWFAGEEWKLEAFRANDEKRGPGMYELTGSRIFNCHVSEIAKGNPRRQVGKTAELALGFAGGVPAFHAFAKIYRVDMAAAYEPLRESVDEKTWDAAQRAHARWSKEGKLATTEMTKEAWIASDVTKRMWREAHPATVAWWKRLSDAVFDAVVRPGLVTHCGSLSYVVKRGFLWCMLPSGRCLAYGSPSIRDVETPWGEKQPCPTALGVDAVTKRWKRFPLTAQILSENPVQAVARDCMRDGMLACERAGYPIVLTVHDEAVAEVEEGFGSLPEFERLLAEMQPWAAGLPIVATGYEAHRYRKDG